MEGRLPESGRLYEAQKNYISESHSTSDAVSYSNDRPPAYQNSDIQYVQRETQEISPKVDMVICSFALHLVDSSSELFSLLWALSLKAKWLVVLAPHKKPEVCQHIHMDASLHTCPR